MALERFTRGRVLTTACALLATLGSARAEVSGAVLHIVFGGGHEHGGHDEHEHGKPDEHEHEEQEGHEEGGWHFHGRLSQYAIVGTDPKGERMMIFDYRLHGHGIRDVADIGGLGIGFGIGFDGWISGGYLFPHLEAIVEARYGGCAVEGSVMPNHHRNNWNVSGKCEYGDFAVMVSGGYDVIVGSAHFAFPKGALGQLNHADLPHLYALEAGIAWKGVGLGMIAEGGRLYPTLSIDALRWL